MDAQLQRFKDMTDGILDGSTCLYVTDSGKVYYSGMHEPFGMGQELMCEVFELTEGQFTSRKTIPLETVRKIVDTSQL